MLKRFQQNGKKQKKTFLMNEKLRIWTGILLQLENFSGISSHTSVRSNEECFIRTSVICARFNNRKENFQEILSIRTISTAFIQHAQRIRCAFRRYNHL